MLTSIRSGFKAAGVAEGDRTSTFRIFRASAGIMFSDSFLNVVCGADIKSLV